MLKKWIACLAALAVLLTASTTTAFADEGLINPDEIIDISDFAGVWDEVDTLYPRQLNIRGDGSFIIIFVSGSILYGNVRREENVSHYDTEETKETVFKLYGEDNAEYASFLVTAKPFNDIYFDDSSHFSRSIEPEPNPEQTKKDDDIGFDPIIAPVVARSEPGMDGALPGDAAVSDDMAPAQTDKKSAGVSTPDSAATGGKGTASGGAGISVPTGDRSYVTAYVVLAVLLLAAACVVIGAGKLRKKGKDNQ